MKKVTALLAVVAIGLAGCGKPETVGGKGNTDFQEQEGRRLGESEITPVPKVTAAPATPAPTAAPTPKPVERTQPPSAARTVKIIAGGQGFDPFAFVVTKGTRIDVTNTTERMAMFSIPSMSINSGELKPGGTYTFVADKPGKHQFEDTERPFAQGNMEVTG